MTDPTGPRRRRQPELRGRSSVQRAVCVSIGGVFLALVLAVAGCGSVTLPSNLPSNLPSISLPTGGGQTATTTVTVTVTRGAATVTVTDEATTTREATTTATETLTRSATETVTHRATETATRTVTAQATPTCQGTDCPGGSPEASNQGLPWFWVLLLVAAAIAAGIVAWRTVRGRQEWDRRFDRARVELDWTERELVPRVLAASTSAAAGTQWEAGRTRVRLAAEELRLLSTSAPGAGRAEQVGLLSRALAELTGALDADTSLNPEADADTVRTAVVGVESARRALREALDRTKQP